MPQSQADAGAVCSINGCIRQLSNFCDPAAVIVSNHVSYMDILVHMEHSFPSFVARGNTRDMFLLGLIR